MNKMVIVEVCLGLAMLVATFSMDGMSVGTKILGLCTAGMCFSFAIWMVMFP